MSEKVWFITGASRGFGNIWAKRALDRGDKVAATARTTTALEGLVREYGDRVLPVGLDVTDHNAVVSAVRHAKEHFGRLDVVLSNAGYGLMGAVEETTIEEARAIFETNFFGTLWVIQAVMPLMREQKGGHIIAVSSIGGLVSNALAGLYNASKFAVEGLVQTVAQEAAGFGIKVTLVEPGPFATDFATETSLKQSKPMPAYDAVREELTKLFAPDAFGDPSTVSNVMNDIVDAAQPPLHVILGPLLPVVKQVYEARIQSWEAWS